MPKEIDGVHPIVALSACPPEFVCTFLYAKANLSGKAARWPADLAAFRVSECGAQLRSELSIEPCDFSRVFDFGVGGHLFALVTRACRRDCEGADAACSRRGEALLPPAGARRAGRPLLAADSCCS